MRDILTDVDDVYFANLTSKDVVRHRLVGEIVDAYARYEENEASAVPAQRQVSGSAHRSNSRR